VTRGNHHAGLAFASAGAVNHHFICKLRTLSCAAFIGSAVQNEPVATCRTKLENPITAIGGFSLDVD
jgi:hypothetical protein